MRPSMSDTNRPPSAERPLTYSDSELNSLAGLVVWEVRHSDTNYLVATRVLEKGLAPSWDSWIADNIRNGRYLELSRSYV